MSGTVHSLHPDVYEYGLADGCERCHEHALHPRMSLDEPLLKQLREIVETGAPARSKTEQLAAMNWELGN